MSDAVGTRSPIPVPEDLPGPTERPFVPAGGLDPVLAADNQAVNLQDPNVGVNRSDPGPSVMHPRGGSATFSGNNSWTPLEETTKVDAPSLANQWVDPAWVDPAIGATEPPAFLQEADALADAVLDLMPAIREAVIARVPARSRPMDAFDNINAALMAYLRARRA